ncbi:Retrovirus-related Pol polyprotein from transposon TNT 1-94 [Nymphaea thermarum]|nr:Retrovirus-related Pol polyprotein from transposon TNT 1-94 [Nymphaea thermarum]
MEEDRPLSGDDGGSWAEAMLDAGEAKSLSRYNSYRMKELDSVMNHVNKMLVMAKDLVVVGNVISDNMQISTILNSLPPSWDVAVTVLSLQFDNLTLEKLPIQLALQQQRLARRKNAELMTVQKKPATSHVPVRPKQFKNRNDGKFKGNFVGTMKTQGTIVKCYRCGKPGNIKKNYRTKILNMKDNNGQDNNNKRKPQGDSDREVICIVSECLFADGDLTGWWVDSGATHHIAKTKEGMIHMEELSSGTNKVYMGNNSYCDVMGIGAYRQNVGGPSVVLNKVLYVPSMRRDLVSVLALTGKGFEVRFILGKNTSLHTAIPGHQASRSPATIAGDQARSPSGKQRAFFFSNGIKIPKRRSMDTFFVPSLMAILYL